MVKNYECLNIGNLSPFSHLGTVKPNCKTVLELRESESVSHSVVSDSLQPHGLEPTRLLCPWNSPGQNTRVGCHFLLQGILTLGLNLRLLHWQVDSLPLNHLGSLKQRYE